MTKPVLLTVDDDVHVLSAVARDLRKRYGRDYRILRAESGAAALELLAELNRQDGTTIVVITHDLSVAARLPRRVEILDGRVVRDSALGRAA